MDDGLSCRLYYELPVRTTKSEITAPTPVMVFPTNRRVIHQDVGDAEGVYFSSMGDAISWIREKRPDLVNEHVYKDVTRWPTRFYMVFETKFMRELAVNNPSTQGPELVPSTLNEALDFFEANYVIHKE